MAIGKGGTGKRQEGDGKTPLGVYPLGVPYTSSKFHLFVPVGYPTAEQQRQGYTGGSVGIHGPARGLSFFGRLTTLVDWTQGCIAVSTDGQIEEIAAWVRVQKPSVVYIE